MFYKTLISAIIATATTLSINSVNAQDFDHSHRSESNIERDEFRKPFETLEFFGVEPDDKVIEIRPGGGWYTEILAPYLYDGEVIAAHYPLDAKSDYQRGSRERYEQKINSSDVYNNVTITDFVFGEPVSEVATNADSVLVFRALHGMQVNGNLAEAFVKFKQMLKSGGTLGIVQHEAPENYSAIGTASKGYLPKSHIIAVAQAAGFVLEAESYMHKNPKDKILQNDIQRGVWALPPTLAVDELKDELKDVGESNRITLLFRLH
mgnify:CR=1 FL=1